MAGNAPNPYTGRAQWLLRARRALALALVAGAVAVAAVYWTQRRRQTSAPKAPVLGLEVQQSAAGVDISKSVAGRAVFRVFAARADKLRPGELDELRQVRILVYDQQGKNADVITGNSFRYDETSGDLYADGEVQIQLENQVRIRARGLRYNVKRGEGTIAQGVEFALGTAAGSAAAAQLNSRTGAAEFSGGVQLQWERPGRPALRLESQSAGLRRQPGGVVAVELRGAAHLQQGVESLTADRLVAQVQGNYVLRHLDAYGHVLAVDGAARDPLRVSAQAAHADFDASNQDIEQLRLEGAVKAEQVVSTGGVRLLRRLSAGQLAMQFTPGNELRALEASKGAALTESGAQAQTLLAPEIDFEFQPRGSNGEMPVLRAITTAGRTRLERGGMLAEADRLRIGLNPDQQPRLAVATGNVGVRQQVGGTERTSQSGRLEIQFSAEAKAQPELVLESGGVRLQQGGRSVHARTVAYTPADGKAVLRGGVEASDATATFTAHTAVWTSHADGSATLSAQAQAGASLTLSLLPSAGIVLPGATAIASTHAASPVVITARNLRWDQPPGATPMGQGGFRGVAVFTGSVRVLQAPDVLRSDQITITAAGSGLPQVEALGHVSSEFVSAGHAPAVLRTGAGSNLAGAHAIRVEAASLRYSQRLNEAHYGGGVRLGVSDAILTAPELSVYFSGGGAAGSPQRALASGGVNVQQPGRSAQAKTMSFDFVHNLIQLEGGPPSIFDAEHGKITGDPLTFSLASDEIQVGGKHGTRVFGQTHGHN